MNNLVWTLLLYMAADRGGGPVALPMVSEDACRAAYTAIVEEQAERLKRVIEEKKGEGTGPGFSYGRCIDGATGRMVVLERRRRADAALDCLPLAPVTPTQEVAMPDSNRRLPVPADHDLAASLVIATGMLARRRGRWGQVDEHNGGEEVVPAYLDRLDAAEGKSVLGPDGRVVDVKPIA